jgi:hypothetical protein
MKLLKLYLLVFHPGDLLMSVPGLVVTYLVIFTEWFAYFLNHYKFQEVFNFHTKLHYMAYSSLLALLIQLILVPISIRYKMYGERLLIYMVFWPVYFLYVLANIREWERARKFEIIREVHSL